MAQSACRALATMATSFFRGASWVKNEIDLGRRSSALDQLFGGADADVEANIWDGSPETR